MQLRYKIHILDGVSNEMGINIRIYVSLLHSYRVDVASCHHSANQYIALQVAMRVLAHEYSHVEKHLQLSLATCIRKTALIAFASYRIALRTVRKMFSCFFRLRLRIVE